MTARALFVVTAFAALGAAPASAAPTPPVDFSLTFSASAPSTPTDASLHILYKDPEDPDNPSGRSPALTRVEIGAPAGTVFDGNALPACRASDAELMLRGPAACPEASGVGRGFGSVTTSFGPPADPFTLDVTLWNYGDGIIELFTFRGTSMTAASDRARFEGPSTMVLHPAVVPGITEREFSWTYVGVRNAFITTPPECPPSGVWTSRLTYTVTTSATYSTHSTTPCTPTAAKRPAVIRPTLTPRRVRAGRRARIHVRLRSSDARCIANATVRLAGRRPVRTNRAGRATLVETFQRRGRRTLTATKRGCAGGRKTLTVLPAS